MAILLMWNGKHSNSHQTLSFHVWYASRHVVVVLQILPMRMHAYAREILIYIHFCKKLFPADSLEVNLTEAYSYQQMIYLL